MDRLILFLDAIAWVALIVGVVVTGSVTYGRLTTSRLQELLDHQRGKRWRPVTPFALTAVVAGAWLLAGAL